MPWKKRLALVTGSIDEELLLRNEYLVTENRILRSKLNGRPQFKDEERQKETTWKEFVHSHMDVLFATDFFTTEVWSCFGLVTYIEVQGESTSEESLGIRIKDGWHR